MRRIDGLRYSSFAALIISCVAACLAMAFHGLSASNGVAALPELQLDFAPTTLALPFLALIAVVIPGVALWSLNHGAAADGLRLAVFVFAMIAVLLAQSVAAFVLAWETMSLASAFLVGTHHERRDVRRATLTYLMVSQFGALCIMAALALLAAHAGSYRFADIAHAAPQLPGGLRATVIVLGLAGFGSKAGLVPLHFWLPSAHPVAPAGASALLSGIMLKIAVYGLLVTTLALAAPIPLGWAITILTAGVGTAAVGALYAAVDSDFKRLLAYSSIENIGVITGCLGLALTALAINRPLVANLAIIALLFHAFAHGVFKSLLFLGAGNVLAATRTTDLEHLGGLRRVLPFTAACVAIGSAGAAALPPVVGFASEWLVFRGFAELLVTAPAPIAALAAGAIALLAAASGLAALAFVKLIGIGFLGVARTAREVDVERFDTSTVGIVWLAFAAVAAGVAPLLVVGPLSAIASALTGFARTPVGALPALPVLLALCPLLGGIGAVVLARAGGMRSIPTWTCGSPVTPRSQYTATAFSKPIRRIFGFVLFPDHAEIRDAGPSRWFPVRIRYDVTTRYIVDDLARNVAAFVQRSARRARIVQAGFLRVYLLYAVVAVIVVLVAAR